MPGNGISSFRSSFGHCASQATKLAELTLTHNNNNNNNNNNNILNTLARGNECTSGNENNNDNNNIVWILTNVANESRSEQECHDRAET